MSGAASENSRDTRAHRFPPEVHNRPSAGARAPYRIVSFNAQGGVRFEGIARCFAVEPLRSASIIILCESDRGTWRAGRRHVADELAERMNMSFAYVAEFGFMRSNGEARAWLGNAILCREPLDDVFAIPLPDPSAGAHGRYRGRREPSRAGTPAALVATVNLAGRRLRICAVHLDSRATPAERAEQMSVLLANLPRDLPTLIAGDLNTTTVELRSPRAASLVLRHMLLDSRRFRCPREHEPLFELLDEAGFDTSRCNALGEPSFTFSRLVPPWMRPRLDWIALRELEAEPGSAAVIPARPGFFSSRVSDHDFICVDLAL